MKMYVRSFSLPAQLAVGIQKVAEKLSVSQSSLLTQLLTEPILDLEENLNAVSMNPSPTEARAVQRRSAAVVEQRIAEYRSKVNEAVADLEPINARHK